TFHEAITETTGHTSRFSMGVDAADFNNDGRPDIAVLDMLPDSEPILKTAASAESYTLFGLKLAAGYHAQYARNTLQLNRGVVSGKLRFSEIGQLAGISATDWSWAPLFADFDNDGWKDLFVTNGIYRRPNDLDYIASLDSGGPPRLDRMPSVPLAKYAFHNNGDLTFGNKARDWGLGDAGFSNGAAYADLDNDGNLDLVVNNINAPASIYRNLGAGGHHLRIVLRGSGANTAGIGAKVTVTTEGRTQLLEQSPTRGFQSSVDPVLHVGLGAATTVDTLTVTWPDRHRQTLTSVRVDTTITLSQSEATVQPPNRLTAQPPLFTDISSQLGITYKHRENTFFDFGREPLMPHLLSTEGPALAVGDANGDGLDDIYAGGAKWQPGELWLQSRDGRFRFSPQPVFRADSLHEDVDAAFVDVDGDGDRDLYVVSGGNEFSEGEPLRDRLYLNERGVFRRGELPDFVHNGSCVVPGDFNRDGHVDLFVGSRVVTRQYGATPRSYLLQGDGAGHFRDVTPDIIANAGMVSGAAWVDGDLIVVGEWMPVKIFHRQNGSWAQDSLPATAGWWNSIQTADLNRPPDGRPDLILGNLGLNSFLRASAREPVRLYLTTPPIVTSYRHGVSYPLAGRDELLQAVPQLRSRYPTYQSFGASRIEDIVPGKTLRQVPVLRAETFASAIGLNRGAGAFEIRPLPVEAQFAPVYAALAGDFDGDSATDVVVAGNFYGVTPVRGRYDASYGLLLKGLGAGSLEPVDMERSGLDIYGQVRRMAFLKRANGERVIVVARNNDGLQILRLDQIAPLDQVVRRRGVAGVVR
ncbi:MAG: VCBS repeat-containing protein, partial [Acidobacteriota bacterium]